VLQYCLGGAGISNNITTSPRSGAEARARRQGHLDPKQVSMQMQVAKARAKHKIFNI